MNVLLINGSPHEKGCTYTALSEVANTLEKHGIAPEKYRRKRSAFTRNRTVDTDTFYSITQ